MPKRITDLDHLTTPAGNDPIPIVDLSDNATKYTTRQELLNDAVDTIDIKDEAVTKEKLAMRKSAFLAYRDVEGTDFAGSSIVIFNKTLFNVGSDYSTTTGIYTVPVNGVYHFSFVCYTNNGAGRAQLFQYRPSLGGLVWNQQTENAGKTFHLTLACQAGDQIYAGGSPGNPMRFYAASNHNAFSGAILWET